MAAAPDGNEGFDFDRWCLENKFPEKIVEWLKKEEFVTPDLLVYFGEKDENSLRSTGVGSAHIRRLEAAIKQLQQAPAQPTAGKELASSASNEPVLQPLATHRRSRAFPGFVAQAVRRYGDRMKGLEAESTTLRKDVSVQKPPNPQKPDQEPALLANPKVNESVLAKSSEKCGNSTPDESSQKQNQEPDATVQPKFKENEPIQTQLSKKDEQSTPDEPQNFQEVHMMPKSPIAGGSRASLHDHQTQSNLNHGERSVAKANPHARKRSIQEMTPSDVKELFESDPEVGVYASLFWEHEIDGPTLLELDDKMLQKDLEVKALGARIKIQRKISALRGQCGNSSHKGADEPVSPIPASVQNFRTTCHDANSVECEWDPSNDKIDGYKIEIKKTVDPTVVVHTQRFPPEKTSATYSSLQECTSYTIQLMTLSGTLESEPVIKTICTNTEHKTTIPNKETSNDLRGDQMDWSVLDLLTNGPLYQQLQKDRTPTISKDITGSTPKLSWTVRIGQLWSKLPQVVKTNIYYDMPSKKRQLQEALFEVLRMEGSFIHSMTVFIDHFMSDKELKSTIKENEYEVLLSNSAQILEASQRFFDDLRARQEKSLVISDVCDIIAIHAREHFPCPFKIYCKNVAKQERTYKRLTEGTQSQRQNERFCQALNTLQLDARYSGVPFSSFLLLPMQHITRFPLLVDRIMALREEGTEYYSTAVDALMLVKDLAKTCYRVNRKQQQTQELDDLMKKLVFDKVDSDFSIMNKDRSVVKQGELTLVPEKGKKKTTFNVVLLSDYLLVTKEEKKGSNVLSVVKICKSNKVSVREIDRIYDGFEDPSPTKKKRRGFKAWAWSTAKPVEEHFKFGVTLLEDSNGKQEEMVFETKSPSELTRWVEAFQQLGTDEEGGRVYDEGDFPIVRVTLRRDPGGPDELSLEEGDTLYVFRKKQDDWWFGETMHDERQGWFPATVVEEVKENDHFRGKELRRAFSESHLHLAQDREPDQDKHKYVALHDYEPQTPEELRIQANQHLTILDYRDGKWYKARSLDTLEVGLVSCDHVKPFDDLQSHEWFVGPISREEAEDRLQAAGNLIGTFLIRSRENVDRSDKHPYTLCLVTNKTGQTDRTEVSHIRVEITTKGKLFIKPGLEFESLQDLVHHYLAVGQIGDRGGLIRTPCPKVKSRGKKSDDGMWEISRDNIKRERNIGHGNFGEVFKGLFKGKVKVAVKIAKAGVMPDDQTLREADTMKNLQHKNIVQLLGVCTKGSPIYIITEFVCNGSLKTYLQGGKGKHLDQAELIRMGAQVATGMEYLQNNNVIHRDLRAANVLVGERNLCKVADFGLARLESIYEASTSTVPIRWTAIEALDTKLFTSQSDVWSFGILMTEILTKGKKTPFEGWTNETVIAQLRHGYNIPKEDDWPQHLYEIMKRCWDREPQSRPTFKYLREVLTH